MASTSATAEPALLPRALDIQRFAGAREQEIRALCAALRNGDHGDKFGVAALPRHLRRRAGSHRPYHRHRLRPNLKLQHKRRKLLPEPAVAHEEDQQPDACCNAQDASAEPGGAAQYTNRRMRRTPALLHERYRLSTAWTEALLVQPASRQAHSGSSSSSSQLPAALPSAASKDSSSSTGGSRVGRAADAAPARRLETHVWHAKRLAMEERYGWLLPAGAAGSGRGSRSFVHATRASALMHDASYLCPLMLSGSWHSVHAVVSLLMDPADSAALADDVAACWDQDSLVAGQRKAVEGARMDGTDCSPAPTACGPAAPAGQPSCSSSCCCSSWEQEQVMLYSPSAFPRGAICPAQLLVSFLCSRCSSRSAEGPAAAGCEAEGMEVEAGAAAGAAVARSAAPAVQACLWVHPAAAVEVFSALQAALSMERTAAGQNAAARWQLGATTAAAAASCQPAVTSAEAAAAASGGGGGKNPSGPAAALNLVHVAADQTAPCASAGAGQPGTAQLSVLNLRRIELRGAVADVALAAALRGAPLPCTPAPARDGSDDSMAAPHQQLQEGCSLSGTRLAGAAGPRVKSQLAHRQDLARHLHTRAAMRRRRRRGETPDCPTTHAARMAPGGPPLPPALAGMRHGDAVQLLLEDPRLCKPVALGSASASLLQCPAGAGAGNSPADAEAVGIGSSVGSPVGSAVDLRVLLQAVAPFSEGNISSLRRQLRLRMLHGGAQLAEGGADVAGSAARASGARRQAARGLQQQEEQQQDVLLRQQHCCYCPTVLVRYNPTKPWAVPGWTLILPAGWVPPFWLALAYAACKPAGQREWRWLHRLDRHAFFPWDYPDTAAQLALMRQRGLQRQLAAAKRPKGKQELAWPPPPPDWQLVLPPGRRVPAPVCPGTAATGTAPSAVTQPSCHPAQRLYVARSYSVMAAALHGPSHGCGAGEAASWRLTWRPVPCAGTAALPPLQPTAGAAAVPSSPDAPRRRQQGSTAAAGAAAESHPTQLQTLSDACCLVEAEVHLMSKGTAEEGAALCFLKQQKAAVSGRRRPIQLVSAKQLRRRQRQRAGMQAALEECGGDSAELALAGGAAGGSQVAPAAPAGGAPAAPGCIAALELLGSCEAAEEHVQIIGYVVTEAPRGAPHRCASLAVVSAAAAWKLRSQQWQSQRRGAYRQAASGCQGNALDLGPIAAYVRNPGSTALYPVYLHLIVEQA